MRGNPSGRCTILITSRLRLLGLEPDSGGRLHPNLPLTSDKAQSSFQQVDRIANVPKAFTTDMKTAPGAISGGPFTW